MIYLPEGVLHLLFPLHGFILFLEAHLRTGVVCMGFRKKSLDQGLLDRFEAFEGFPAVVAHMDGLA